MDEEDDGECHPWRIFQVPYIDRVLRRKGLRRIMSYPYTAGDCLFDSVLYLLGDGVAFDTSVGLRRAMVGHYRNRVRRKDPKAVEWLENFLVLDNLQDLHPELRRLNLDEKDAASVYLHRMRLSASCGGLWGDHFCAFWLQELLGRSIKIWLADTGKVLSGEDGGGGGGGSLRLVYHSRYHGFSFAHYEPVVKARGLRFVCDSDSDEEEEAGGGGSGGGGGGDSLTSVVQQKRVVGSDLEDEVLEEETETESDEDENEDEPPPLPSSGSSQSCVDQGPPRLEEEEEEGEVDRNGGGGDGGLEEDGADSRDNSSRPDGVASVSSSSGSAVDVVEEREVAETLKKFSSDVKLEYAHPKRLKRDSKASDGQPEQSDQATTSRSVNPKVVNAECSQLSNFEVLHHLKSKTGITKSELSVRQYLVHTPAASQRFESLRELSQEPLIRRLHPVERIQIANLQPDLVQLYLIIQNIEKRFSNEEIEAILSTVHRFLT